MEKICNKNSNIKPMATMILILIINIVGGRIDAYNSNRLLIYIYCIVLAILMTIGVIELIESITKYINAEIKTIKSKVYLTINILSLVLVLWGGVLVIMDKASFL
ncbi:hypothetical protein [Clostridium senegalense]|uniref:hypothetical protein n=1 Tax=Clostridium senegalense TaxID=1465809 RepID=UPI000288EAD6|nr:hypothetical protein [Clostridium senegalense]